MSKPALVAHRGYALRYPENTLVALEAAITAGALFVEVDVQLTRDGYPVLFHDRTLERMCGVPGHVHELTLAQIRALSSSERGKFGDRFASEGIASLTDFVQLLQRHPRVFAFVEIKRIAIEQFGHDRVLERVLSALDAAIDQCGLISFSLDFLQTARAAHPIPLGAVFDTWKELQASALGFEPEFVFVDVDGLPSDGRLEHGRARIAVYEIAEPERALAVHARGVHLVETFAIGEMLSALEGREA